MPNHLKDPDLRGVTVGTPDRATLQYRVAVIDDVCDEHGDHARSLGMHSRYLGRLPAADRFSKPADSDHNYSPICEEPAS
ncbi:hypothetical protein [Demequina sp.]|uniref:hypothetical protein n=1 Tax=Demequina sp. TaxID=2050685 RepID=UPI003A8BD239